VFVHHREPHRRGGWFDTRRSPHAESTVAAQPTQRSVNLRCGTGLPNRHIDSPNPTLGVKALRVGIYRCVGKRLSVRPHVKVQDTKGFSRGHGDDRRGAHRGCCVLRQCQEERLQCATACTKGRHQLTHAPHVRTGSGPGQTGRSQRCWSQAARRTHLRHLPAPLLAGMSPPQS
jgi:hypothetical protein